MDRLFRYLASPLVCLLLFACEDNMQSPIYAVTFGPPENLSAVSQSVSSVTLHWTPGVGAGDSTFLGYIIAFNGIEDTVPKTVLGYVAESLAPGAVRFDVSSYQSGGPRSDAATIVWAPATRFEIDAIVVEFFLQEPGRISGFSVGSQTRTPYALPIEPIDTLVLRDLDFYLFGSNGVIEAPLSLFGAVIYRSDLRITKFSTVIDSSADLNFPLKTFPHDSTFSRDTVRVNDNRIYYLKIEGDAPADVLYARVHVSITPGLAFPFRQVVVNVSLQRQPGVPYAERVGTERRHPSRTVRSGLRSPALA